MYQQTITELKLDGDCNPKCLIGTAIKQDGLVIDLNDDWNRKKISLLEQKETINATLLKQISAAFKISVEAIQNFDEKQVVNIIAKHFMID